MPRNLQTEINSAILAIRKNLIRLRQTNKEDESYISYILSLINLFGEVRGGPTCLNN